MKKKIFEIFLWLLCIVICISISSISFVKSNHHGKHQCNIETFKPYNSDYNNGIDVALVKCADVECSKSFKLSAPITIHNITSTDSKINDKNKTLEITTSGDITTSGNISNNNITLANDVNVKSINNFKINGTTLLNVLYPVGSIYISMNNTNPSTFIGGKWTQISDRFLYCSTSGARGIGGASTAKLSTDNLPSHNHTFKGNLMEGSMANANEAGWIRKEQGGWCNGVFKKSDLRPWAIAHSNKWDWGGAYNIKFSATPSGTITNTGGSKAFSIMPPYIKIYCWYRTA